MPRTPTGLSRGGRTRPLPVGTPPRRPQRPRGLDRVAVVVWEKIWNAGAGWLDPKSDALLVELVARKASEIARMERRLAGVDSFYETKSGAILAHPGFAQLRAAQAQFVAWSALLGLNPSTRSELHVTQNVEVDELNLFRMRKYDNFTTGV